jgi:predicted nucleotidyltransferase
MMGNNEFSDSEIRVSSRRTKRLSRQNINIPRKKLQAFCSRWKIAELALFGSVLREDFQPGSDIDILVSFVPDAHWSLLDMVSMQDELSAIFNRKVDLVEREAIEQSDNYIRRRHILSNMEPIYGEG